MVNIIEPKIEIMTDINAKEIMENIERAARTCYKTECKDAEKMVRMLLEKHHEAMIEFSGMVDVLVTCDIGSQRDFSRHRHISMACESTRYCNYNKEKFGNEISVIYPYHIKNPEIYAIWVDSMIKMEENYKKMAELGAKPDELRMILPLSTACTFHIGANLREWRHILRLRCSTAAHPIVRKVACTILSEFRRLGLGVFFEDIEG